MIGRLRGTLVEKAPPVLIIDVGGVGYELEAPMSTFYKLPETGASLVLYTHMVVREDAQLLYGFSDKSEKTVFRTLLKVNGVGPKVALAILSTLGVSDIIETVQMEDVTRLTQVPGIGKKTAERLLVELRDRISADDIDPSSFPASSSPESAAPASAIGDAVSALIALGYKPNEASRAVRAVAEEGDASEELIRKALKSMG